VSRGAGAVLEDSVAEEAVLWMVRLQSGEVASAERHAFEVWLATDPRHAAAFSRIQKGLGAAQSSPWRGRSSAPILQAINAPSGRRTFLRNALAFGGLALSISVLGRTAGVSWPSVDELETGTAERRTWQLADGSHVQLNARSRVATAFVDNQRRLQLYQGELVLDVAKDSHTPFTLRTAQGVISSTGGRLMVRQNADATRLSTLEGSLQLTPGKGPSITIEPQRSVLFNDRVVVEQQAMRKGETAWLSGWLEARNQPLGEVVDTLRTYRRGIVRLDNSLASLSVSGLYPLDNSDQTLEMLEQQLPIRVNRFGPYWISIERA
jgi:transmembrane sensor